MNIAIMALAELSDRIVTLGRSARENQQEAHVLAVAALIHVSAHGDTRPLVQLVNALPKAFRREALCVWASENTDGKLVIRLSKDSGIYEAKLHGGWNVEGVIDIEGADATPFYDLTQEKRPGKTKGIDDLIKQLRGFANNDKTNDDGSPKVSEQARELAAFLIDKYEKANKLDLAA